MQVWKSTNTKSAETCFILFNENKKPFTNANDQRLTYLNALVTMFQSVDIYPASTKIRILGQGQGIIKLIAFLLKKINYVLTVKFQIHRIEWELEMYQQLSRENSLFCSASIKQSQMLMY